MPTNPVNKSPFDLDNNLSIGITFPLMDDGQFNPSFTVKDQVKTNILNVLLTEPGERLYLPNFGVGLKQLLFQNITNTQIISDKIDEQLGIHVPEIQIMETNVNFNREEHLLNIVLVYAVSFENQIDSIQININGGNEGIDIYQSATGY